STNTPHYLSVILPHHPLPTHFPYTTLFRSPDRVYHGALRQVIPSADRAKGTVKVKVGISDPDDNILPDLSARVNFTSEPTQGKRSEEHTSELQSRSDLVCRLLLEKKK